MLSKYTMDRDMLQMIQMLPWWDCSPMDSKNNKISNNKNNQNQKRIYFKRPYRLKQIHQYLILLKNNKVINSKKISQVRYYNKHKIVKVKMINRAKFNNQKIQNQIYSKIINNKKQIRM